LQNRNYEQNNQIYQLEDKYHEQEGMIGGLSQVNLQQRQRIMGLE
jgi:uncharacterized coiled-coil protein SlyX